MRTVVKIAAVLLTAFFIWNLFIYISGRDTEELAVRGSIRDTVAAQGHLIKTEHLIEAPADGVLQPYVSDCEKSGKESVLAAVLSGETDEAARKQMTVLKSRISALEDAIEANNFGEDTIAVDTSIDENIKKIIKYSMQGKMTNIDTCKNDIVKLVDKRSVITNGSGESLFEQLRSEQRTLESRLGNLINEITAPCSGVFTARLDGLEEVLTPEKINELTVSDIEDIKSVKTMTQSKVSKGDHVCKIIDNFKWYLAAVLTGEDIDGMAQGASVKISFRDVGGDMANAVVHRISQEENGKHVVVFRLNRDLSGILSRRHVSIDIIKHTYEGLKLSAGALCMEGDVTGVYVENGSTRVFKPVNVLYHAGDYMIVEENNTQQGSLLLYDNVVVSKTR